MTRPTKEEPREKRITIRLTDLEYQTLSEESARSHKTLADYIRHQALHGRITIRYNIKTGESELTGINEEMHKIGINLNQLAAYLHTGGTMTDGIIVEIRTMISNLFALRQQIVKFIRRGETYGDP